MSGVPLSTLLPALGSASPSVLEHWVAAALAHAAALRQYDASLYPRDPSRQASAEHLHGAWRAWVEDAEIVLRQAEALTTGDHEVPGLADLRLEIGFAHCLLKMPPALIARRREQVERGDFYPAEEVRRELRDGSLR